MSSSSSPSQTALFAALYRAMDARERADGSGDTLAASFLPGLWRLLIRFAFIRRSIQGKNDHMMPGLVAYVLARTEFIDGQFREALESGAEQIVLLGAGYDTRALRMLGEGAKVKVFELDSGQTLAQKRKHLRAFKTPLSAAVVSAPIDFNEQQVSDVLAAAGYESAKQTLFIWEGVSYYLEPSAIESVLRLLVDNQHAESRLAFDYVITLDDDNVDASYGARTFLETWRTRRAAEPFQFSIEEGTLEPFLEERGLEAAQHLDAHEIEQRYLPAEGEAAPKRVTGCFRFAVVARRS